jgi:hypothetical protein
MEPKRERGTFFQPMQYFHDDLNLSHISLASARFFPSVDVDE